MTSLRWSERPGAYVADPYGAALVAGAAAGGSHFFTPLLFRGPSVYLERALGVGASRDTHTCLWLPGLVAPL